jgi:hypothetical protein
MKLIVNGKYLSILNGFESFRDTTFVWKGWRNPRNSLVKIPVMPYEIQTGFLRNASGIIFYNQAQSFII